MQFHRALHAFVPTFMALALLLPGMPAQAAKSPKVERRVFSDGMELLFAKVPGAHTASMRFVVRAGSFEDPDGKTGLAHVLEHLIFQGTYALRETEFWDTMRKRGAHVNAFTSTEETIYALDAPTDAFSELLGIYVGAITNPALLFADLDRERRVIDTENAYHGGLSMLWAFDQAVFPSFNRGLTVIGTPKTREAITDDDLIAYYRRNYLPSKISVIITGDLDFDAVEKQIASHVALPSIEDMAAPPEGPSDPNLPVEIKELSFSTTTIVGHKVPKEWTDHCHDLAGLAEVRVWKKVAVDEPIASDFHVRCHRSRQHLFLVALVFTDNALGSGLPEMLNNVFADLGRVPPSREEKKILTARRKAQARLLTGDPMRLADALAWSISRVPQDRVLVFEQSLRPPKLKRISKKSRGAIFKRENGALLHFSPFEQH
jgi:hypothetical protein